MAQKDPYAADDRKKTMALGIGIGVLAAVLVLGSGMAALGLFSQRGDAVTKQGSEPPAAMLPQTAAAPPPVTPMELPVTEMPADVRAWLEHLRQTEEWRKRLSSDQIGSLAVMMAEFKTSGVRNALGELFADPTGEEAAPRPSDKERLATSGAEKRAQWAEVEAFFHSKRPPAECAPIAASYAQVLGETGAMIVEVLGALESAEQSPEAAISALTRMQGTSSARIDSAARATDAQVGEICAKYKTPKWFSIAADVGGGLMGRIGF